MSGEQGPRPQSTVLQETDPHETYWILRREQVECLASPRRQELLDRLAACGPESVKECAQAVGLKPSAAYRHLSALQGVGLIHTAGTRVVNRKQETLYEAVAPRMRLAGALSERELHGALRRVVAALGRQMTRDFERGLDSDRAVATGPERNVGFYRHVAAPDEETLAQINRRLDQVAELLWQPPKEGRPLISLGWVMAPGSDRPETEDEAPSPSFERPEKRGEE